MSAPDATARRFVITTPTGTRYTRRVSPPLWRLPIGSTVAAHCAEREVAAQIQDQRWQLVKSVRTHPARNSSLVAFAGLVDERG
jgi:hypothetical protein